MRLFPRVPTISPDPSPDSAPSPPRPSPLGNSLVASARRLRSDHLKRPGQRGGPTAQQGWQDDAWDAYDQVGEHRFIVTTLANRLAQANFYVGVVNGDGTDTPAPTEDERLREILRRFQGTPAAFRQTLKRMAENLSVAGDIWLVGIPRHLLPENHRTAPMAGEDDLFTPLGREVEGVFVDDLDWRAFSVSEIGTTTRHDLTLKLGEAPEETIVVSADEVWAIRVWDPHPRRWWEASSPARSSLPVLRELIGLTKMVSAQIDSRLAGAGLLVLSQKISDAIKERSRGEMDDEEVENSTPIMDALIEYMTAPIAERDTAAAVVPLLLEIPDGVDTPQHLTFDSPLDERALSLREEAIRRFALSQDAPPELLLGTGGMNHWGAWLVQDDVVASHLEPPLSLICDAITSQFLWPVMLAEGYSPEEIQRTVIWYDVSHLVVRPNRGKDARELHARGAISDEAVRLASGFDENDAPEEVEESSLEIAIRMATAAPSLMTDPGLSALVREIEAARAIERGLAPPPLSPSPTEEEEAPGEEGGNTLPATEDDPAEPPAMNQPEGVGV